MKYLSRSILLGTMRCPYFYFYGDLAFWRAILSELRHFCHFSVEKWSGCQNLLGVKKGTWACPVSRKEIWFFTHNLRLSLFPRNHTILTLRLVKSQLLNQLGLGFDKSIKVVRAAFVATFRRFVFKVGHIKLAGGNRWLCMYTVSVAKFMQSNSLAQHCILLHAGQIKIWWMEGLFLLMGMVVLAPLSVGVRTSHWSNQVKFHETNPVQPKTIIPIIPVIRKA